MSILGNDSDNPLSGNTPPDTFSDDSPTGLTDQGDSVADDSDVAASALAQEDPDTLSSEAVRDPAPAVEPAVAEPVNDTGGVGDTRAADPDYPDSN